MPLTRDLRHFKRSEFKHPELINETAAEGLDEIREQYGSPLVVTDDARLSTDLPKGTAGPGKSLHYKGQAFDVRIRDMSTQDLWRFVRSVINVGTWWARGQKSGIELELVWSPTDKHAHIAFFLGDGRESRLLLRIE